VASQRARTRARPRRAASLRRLSRRWTPGRCANDGDELRRGDVSAACVDRASRRATCRRGHGHEDSRDGARARPRGPRERGARREGDHFGQRAASTWMSASVHRAGTRSYRPPSGAVHRIAHRRRAPRSADASASRRRRCSARSWTRCRSERAVLDEVGEHELPSGSGRGVRLMSASCSSDGRSRGQPPRRRPGASILEKVPRLITIDCVSSEQ
jgi:hypothetical protein